MKLFLNNAKIIFAKLLLFCVISSCNSNNQSSKLEERISQLEKENKSLKQSENSIQIKEPVNQYAVIVLHVESLVEKTPGEMGVNFDPYKKYKGYYVSGVRTESDDSESNKYRLMDEFQSDFMNDSHEGKVDSRNIYFYNTYEEASKAREKFMLNR